MGLPLTQDLQIKGLNFFQQEEPLGTSGQTPQPTGPVAPPDYWCYLLFMLPALTELQYFKCFDV